MTSIANKIMKSVRRHGRGGKVFTAKDFLQLGSRAAVDKALSRLTKAGDLRRVGRGLYDWPRPSAVLDRPAPPSVDAVVDAVRRRSNVFIRPANIAAANALGLTHAVPTQPDFIASRKIGDIRVGNRTLRFSSAGVVLTPWLDSPAAPLVQAMVWLHDRKLADPGAIAKIRDRSAPDAKAALSRGLSQLPAWALAWARDISGNRAHTGNEPSLSGAR